jgi:hypothetical protein
MNIKGSVHLPFYNSHYFQMLEKKNPLDPILCIVKSLLFSRFFLL